MDKLALKSSRSDVELHFFDVAEDYFHIAIVSSDHSASRKVYSYTDELGVLRLFEEAAREWRGWAQAKVWTSLEGELRLEMSTDGRGHVFLRAELHSSPGGHDPWRVDAEVSIEAGQLDQIAADAREVWGLLANRALNPPGIRPAG